MLPSGMVVLAVASLASFAAGFGMGWQVNGWRLNAVIEAQRTRMVALESANRKCASDIESVRDGIAALVQAQERENQRAAEAAKLADARVERHLQKAEEILRRPLPRPEEWCGTIKREQEEYVRERRK